MGIKDGAALLARGMVGRLGRLRRVGRGRGFGVQSPWAFLMARDVICERLPYYAYGPLAAAFPGLGRAVRRECELCLRLSNRLQPRLVVNCGAHLDAFGAYMRAGCAGAACVDLPPDADAADVGALAGRLHGIVIARVGPGAAMRPLAEAVALEAGEGSLLVLEGISRDPAAGALWKEILESWPHVVTFDTYHCGLAFLSHERYKQNHIVNP